jgi:hypothetical protein
MERERERKPKWSTDFSSIQLRNLKQSISRIPVEGEISACGIRERKQRDLDPRLKMRHWKGT